MSFSLNHLKYLFMLKNNYLFCFQMQIQTGCVFIVMFVVYFEKQCLNCWLKFVFAVFSLHFEKMGKIRQKYAGLDHPLKISNKCPLGNYSIFWFNYAENGHFDQRLECAAPKRWSKYTTGVNQQLGVASFKSPHFPFFLIKMKQ